MRTRVCKIALQFSTYDPNSSQNNSPPSPCLPSRSWIRTYTGVSLKMQQLYLLAHLARLAAMSMDYFSDWYEYER